uniref:Uncharacterized protein n=1 Tax=Ciona savignyi TaxID=51511 RepID=H2ZMK8_CIOSA
MEEKLDTNYSGKMDLRHHHGLVNTDAVLPQHQLVSQPGNTTHPNTLLFLREESQRSESADSAYSGSQGSNSSDYAFPCHANRAPNMTSQYPQSNNGLLQMPTHNARTQANSLLPEVHHFNSVLPPGVQRYPQVPDTTRYNGLLEFNGTTGAVVTSSGRFSPYTVPGVKSQHQINHVL